MKKTSKLDLYLTAEAIEILKAIEDSAGVSRRDLIEGYILELGKEKDPSPVTHTSIMIDEDIKKIYRKLKNKTHRLNQIIIDSGKINNLE